MQSLAELISMFALIIMSTEALLYFASSESITVISVIRFACYLTYSICTAIYVSSGILRHRVLRTTVQIVQEKTYEDAHF